MSDSIRRNFLWISATHPTVCVFLPVSPTAISWIGKNGKGMSEMPYLMIINEVFVPENVDKR